MERQWSDTRQEVGAVSRQNGRMVLTSTSHCLSSSFVQFPEYQFYLFSVYINLEFIVSVFMLSVKQHNQLRLNLRLFINCTAIKTFTFNFHEIFWCYWFLCNWILDFLMGRSPGGKGRKQHICLSDTQHGGPSRVCA